MTFGNEENKPVSSHFFSHTLMESLHKWKEF